MSDTVGSLVITERKIVSTPYATRKHHATLDWVKFDGDLAWDGSVSPNAKALYAALGRFADLHDRSTPTKSDLAPTRKFLAECIGKSKDTVDRAIKELEDGGLVEVERRRDPNNPKLNPPSVYYLLDAERWDGGIGCTEIPKTSMHSPAPSTDAPRVRRRRPISQRKRARILERDGHACLACESADDLTLDHVVHWSKGGSNADDNLRVLCRPCNSSRGTGELAGVDR
ncbi:HNH endonuclease [Streptomyces sp. 5-10]|uniref:HNH endonuclease n=1 Tax=Streptomyces sp. 5-10 TaxID=878925 RepID=UPI00168AEA57|nr:HNH endonuclease [Streptomyces sp. 5-10]MBD3004693.1 HNH endonuclease [Streptomyces sp. 5-10]